MLAALARQFTPDATAVPDADLLDRFARTADAAAFELLVWRHGAMVWAASRRVLGADAAGAEDASQAAFAALARHADRVRNGNAVGPWLHRVAVRAALDLRARRGRALPTSHPADPYPDPARLAAGREEHELIDAAVNALPERLRAAFVLCELEGRSNADAAAALGCPVGTVESRLTRARQRLRAVLSARGVTPALAVTAAALPASTRAALVAGGTGGVSAAVRALAARAAGGSGVSLRAVVGAGLVFVATATAFGLAAGGAPQPPDPPAKERAAVNPPAPTPDPLPPGAVARLGSTRLRHPAWVRDVAYSADGSRLASVGHDDTVRLWDATTGRELFAVKRDDGTLDRVGFADGGKTLVAVGTSKKKAAADLWLVDVAKQEVAARHVLPWDRPLEFDARVSPDGTRLALAEHDLSRAWVINVRTGNVLLRLPFDADDRPTCAAFAADSKTVAFGTDAGSVKVYDAATGAAGKVYHEPNARFARVAFAPDGTRVAAADTNLAGVVAWDAATGRKQWRSSAGALGGLAFGTDGRFVLRDSFGSRASTLDATDGGFPGIGDTPGAVFGSMAEATCLAVHPGGKVVAFGTRAGPIGVFEVATGKSVAPSADPPHPVRRMRFTPDGKTLYGWGADWYAWDIATGKQTRVTNEDWNYGTPLSPDGRFTAGSVWYSGRLLPGNPDSGTRFEVRDAKTGAVVHSYPASRFRGEWSEFTPDGAGILGAASDGVLRVWDFATGNERQTLTGHKAPPRYQAFSPDGKALATASRADKGEEFPVRVWNLATGKEAAKFNPGVPVGAVAVSRGGARVAALAYTNSAGKADPRELATVWDAATGWVLARVPQGGDGECLALSPDGALVAVAPRWKGEVRVYDVDAGVERFLFRHAGPVTDLAFAPDGRTLAAASQDVPVTLWDVSGKR